MFCDRPRLRTVTRAAFTLVELMVVIVIVGLLASAVTLSVRSYLIASKQNIAKLEISNICQALDTFYAANDRYPTNEEGFDVLARPSEQFADALLSKVPLDPWRNPYQYNQPGRSGPYEVICLGADGREGGQGADQDIANDDLDRKQSR
jgi:general secretion pathway protein G